VTSTLIRSSQQSTPIPRTHAPTLAPRLVALSMVVEAATLLTLEMEAEVEVSSLERVVMAVEAAVAI
jgi:hypothetical protein